MFALRSSSSLFARQQIITRSIVARSSGIGAAAADNVDAHPVGTRSLVIAASSAYRRHVKKRRAKATGEEGKKVVKLVAAPPIAASVDTIHLVENPTAVEEKPTAEEKPTKRMANSMPLTCKEMDNGALLTLAALEVEDARAEVLRRHIMSIDSVSYEEACKTFDEIAKFNRKGMFKHTIPYKIGIAAALVAGFGSFPLVFHYPTVIAFNEACVTADVPETKDLETWLEVGSWSWNWMEPPLGQISFFLLCLQFARAQMENLGIKPYTAKMKQLRAKRLVERFPKYDAKLLTDYCVVDTYYKD